MISDLDGSAVIVWKKHIIQSIYTFYAIWTDSIIKKLKFRMLICITLFLFAGCTDVRSGLLPQFPATHFYLQTQARFMVHLSCSGITACVTVVWA